VERSDDSVVDVNVVSVCSYEGGKVVRRAKGISTPRRSDVSSYEPLADSRSLPWSGIRLVEDMICFLKSLSYLS
jgi:hypothetical protein